MYRKRVERRTYTIRNRGDQDRSLVIEHPVRKSWKLIEPDHSEETSAGYYRFKLPVPASSTRELAVLEEQPQESVFQLVNITPDQISIWLRDKSIDASVERALGPILDKKNQIAELQSRVETLDGQENQIFRDQERVRENLNRLGRTPEEARLRQRYLQQLEEQEDRLGQLRADRATLRERLVTLQQELDQLLQDLTLEREL
jgi:hypothetical protein